MNNVPTGEGLSDAEAAGYIIQILYEAVMANAICMGCNHILKDRRCDYCDGDPRAIVSAGRPMATMFTHAAPWPP